MLGDYAICTDKKAINKILSTVIKPKVVKDFLDMLISVENHLTRPEYFWPKLSYNQSL